MTGLHSSECYCETCGQLGVGAQLYREIAEELASDDPEVIDPIWRAACEARIATHRQQRMEPVAALLVLLLPDRRYAAA
jgi:hypothetical protein